MLIVDGTVPALQIEAPEELTEEVIIAKLRACGGAHQPTGYEFSNYSVSTGSLSPVRTASPVPARPAAEAAAPVAAPAEVPAEAPAAAAATEEVQEVQEVSAPAVEEAATEAPSKEEDGAAAAAAATTGIEEATADLSVQEGEEEAV